MSSSTERQPVVGFITCAWNDKNGKKPTPGRYAVEENNVPHEGTWQPVSNPCPLCDGPMVQRYSDGQLDRARIAFVRGEIVHASLLPRDMAVLQCQACDVRFACPSADVNRLTPTA